MLTVTKLLHSRAAANKHLTPCTLELGGKSPAYIDWTGNLEYAVKRLCWGKFNNCGQICVAPDYVLCTKAVQDQILPLVEKIVKEFYSDSASSPDYCRIVSDRHQARLQTLLDTTKGKVVIGGKSAAEEKFMAPTVVTDVELDDPLMKDEIFGPILPIVTVNSAEEAVNIINSRDKPLALYLFTTSEKVQELFTRKTSSGGICINDTIMHLSVEELPFGGVGASGMGAYHGKHGFDTFTHYKVTVFSGKSILTSPVQPVLKRDLTWFAEKLGEMRYPPYNTKTANMMRNITKNRSDSFS